MDRKVEGMEKHIDFLYEELESKEKEIDELKESVKHTDEVFRKNTAYAQDVLVEKCSLSKQLEIKEEDIRELKKNKQPQCQNGCDRMEEVMKYK